jgi:DNA-binding response OmpR family regulator
MEHEVHKLRHDPWRTQRQTDTTRIRNARRCCVVSQVRNDWLYLSRLLVHSNLAASFAPTCTQALDDLSRQEFCLIIADDVLPDGSWRDILMGMAKCGSAARLVVASRLADERLWADVLNLGGYDALAKPFRADEIAWLVHLTCDRTRDDVLQVNRKLPAAAAPRSAEKAVN